jgi:hypothetical protein
VKNGSAEPGRRYPVRGEPRGYSWFAAIRWSYFRGWGHTRRGTGILGSGAVDPSHKTWFTGHKRDASTRTDRPAEPVTTIESTQILIGAIGEIPDFIGREIEQGRVAQHRLGGLGTPNARTAPDALAQVNPRERETEGVSLRAQGWRCGAPRSDRASPRARSRDSTRIGATHVWMRRAGTGAAGLARNHNELGRSTAEERFVMCH